MTADSLPKWLDALRPRRWLPVKLYQCADGWVLAVRHRKAWKLWFLSRDGVVRLP